MQLLTSWLKELPCVGREPLPVSGECRLSGGFGHGCRALEHPTAPESWSFLLIVYYYKEQLPKTNRETLRTGPHQTFRKRIFK